MKTIMYHGGLASNKLLKEFFKNVPTIESFVNINNITNKNYCTPYFLDSGAYSAYTKGKEVNLKDYIKFIHNNKNKIDVYVNLDVIGDYRKSFENYKIMVKEGLNPIPVWHMSSPIKYLHKYVEFTNYIGIGEIAKASVNKRYTTLNNVFGLYPDPTKVGFHGFGIGSQKMIKLYPWKSVDAMTALFSAKNGTIQYPNICEAYVVKIESSKRRRKDLNSDILKKTNVPIY